MKRVPALLAISIACACLANAQALSNWNTNGGDPQRTGWEKADPAISKDTVKDFQLLWKMKLDNQPKSVMMPPLILGRLISYRGFKELAFVGTSSDVVYAIDADLGKIFWQKHLEYSVAESQAAGTCARMAMPTMAPPVVAGRGVAPPAIGKSGFIGTGPPSVYAISSDGRLHRLNSSTGDDMVQPVKVLPANAMVYSLSMFDNVIYAVTAQNCNDAPNAVWAIDLSGDALKVASFPLRSDGLASPLIGTDGTVYVQTAGGLIAFTPRDLQLKAKSDGEMAAASPVVFPYNGRDVIVTSEKSGRLRLLDSADLAKQQSRSAAIGAVSGGLSSWQAMDGARWILAPVNGSLSAFRVEDQNGQALLTHAWTSRDLNLQQPPVIAGGVVFALTSGGSRATLYALDGVTGKELYSSRNLAAAPASSTGMTVANGRVYFTTTDGTVYAFGIFMEH